MSNDSRKVCLKLHKGYPTPIELILGVCVGARAGGATTYFSFPLPNFYTTRKILREASPAE